MTHSPSFFTNVGAPGDVTRIVFGNDRSLPVVGVGSTRLIVDGGPVDITNVLHDPGLKVNLLSITQLTKKGVKVTIDDAKMNLFWKGKQFAQGVLNGELYQLKTHPRVASSNVAQGSKATLKVWHNRLAHAKYDSVKELANKGLAKGFDVIAGDNEKGVCAACVEGKMARKPFGSRTSPLAKNPLALVDMDVCGPMRHASKGGARFLLVMLDDATWMCWTRLLKAKGDVTKAIQEWAIEVCDDDKKRIKAIHSDGGGEFVNAELEKWMKTKGIKHDVTTPYTPQQNGAAERLNRTLVEAVHSLLQHSKLGSEWWVCPAGGTAGAAGGTGAAGPAGVGATGASGAPGAGAAEGVSVDGSPGAGSSAGAGVGAVGAGGAAGTSAAAGGTGAVPAGSGDPARPRPYFVPLLEQVLGLPPSSGRAPSLECPQPIQSQSLLQPVSPLPAPSPYTGPTEGLAERREPASRPASPVCAARTSGRASRQRPPAVPRTHQMALRPSTATQRVPLPSPSTSSLPVLADPESDSLRAASPAVARLLSTVVTDPSFESAAASALVAELVDFAACCRLDYATGLVSESASICPPSVGDIPTPRSYAEAIEGPYSSQWQSAMDAEMASWKVKQPPGSPHVFKARYVARGFSQRQGVDYFQTFSLTPKMTSLRVLLHVAAQRDYELHSLDFSTAFLQGSLHEEIWLRRPPGFTGSFPPGTQWSLRRPVYGLRQAPREWQDTLRTTLAALGFAPSTADPSLFLRTDTSLPPFYILVYVDDLVFATADTAGLTHVKSELQKKHTCTDLGELRSYLGLQITRDRAQCTITLTQSHMVQQVLQRFDFTYSSPQATPLSTRHSLSALPSDESVEPSGPYPELVGCLMYLMTCTRPDLAYPLSILARYVAPGRHRPEHMAAAKRVLRYLCGTLGLGLVLGGRRPVVLTGHADASWADDQATQRSSQGYTFSLGSGSVSWRSTRSSSVLGSSCEAEIYAGAMAAQELRWLTYLLTDLGEQPRSPPVLYVDNKAMLALCREHRLEHRTKHIALRYFLARELQQRGQLRLAYVASQANTADIFTKALPPGDHQRFCTLLACSALLDWSCDLLFSPTLPMGVFPLVPNSLLVQSFLVLFTLVAWIRNRLPTKVLSGTTPFEAWTGTKPNLSHLRTFGCLCYYHVPDPLRHKLQPKAHAAIYLGIAANERAWRVWDLGEMRVVTSRDMVFEKDKFPTKEQPTPQLTIVLRAQEEDEAIEVPSQVEKEAKNGGGENEESDDDVVEVPSTAAANSSTPSSLPLALTRKQRTRRLNTKYTEYATVAVGELDEERAAYCFATLGDPRTHTEALASLDVPL
ncbi:unnamed protein product [Closterium sp. NIES-53]